MLKTTWKDKPEVALFSAHLFLKFDKNIEVPILYILMTHIKMWDCWFMHISHRFLIRFLQISIS